MIIAIILDYCDYSKILRLLRLLREFRIFVMRVCKHTRFLLKHHSSVLQVTRHTTLCYLGSAMDCHVIFRSISSLVQRRILYVGFLDLNRGFQHFCDASDDIGRHDGSGTHPCNYCTWNTHVPWIHCNRLSICITRHQRQLSNTRSLASVNDSLWFVFHHANCMWGFKTQYEHVLRKHGMYLNDFLVQISNEYSQFFEWFGWAGLCWRGVCLFVVMSRAAAKKPSENDFIRCWYGNLHMYILLRKSWCRFPPLCRDGPPGAKCPVGISDLVLVFNFTNQELALSDKELNSRTYAL